MASAKLLPWNVALLEDDLQGFSAGATGICPPGGPSGVVVLGQSAAGAFDEDHRVAIRQRVNGTKSS